MTARDKPVKTVVLGIGNLLLGDEGVGVHAAHALMSGVYPPDVTVLEVGTAILDALPAFEQAERIIVLDAVKADGPPGSVYRLPFDDCEHARCIASMHGFDLSRVMALAGRKQAPEVLVMGIEPERMSWSLELSPRVAKALPILLQEVERELRTTPQEKP
jgi:hydrogenase maturation protease